MMAAAIIADGGTTAGEDGALASALQDNDADAVIAIGGTGAGRNDASVMALSGAGQVAFHGIGLMPGETAAIGVANARPVLIVPGRIDAALACWLVLGRRIFARLAGCAVNDVAASVKLTRKVTSTIGIAEVVLLKRSGSEVEPLASGYLPLQALARADCYCVVPAESEGFPAGATVEREAAAMSTRQAATETELIAAIRDAARQEQFLEVVSAEEATRALRRASRSVAACAGNALRSTPRSAACWRMTSRRRSTCRLSTAPASTASPCAPPTLPGASEARRGGSASMPK